MLAQIADLPDDRRGAAFVCAVALVLPGGLEHLVEGRQSGRLLRAPRGAGGFGYDPIFLGDGETRTNAELTPQEKDAISHRGKALRELATLVAEGAPAHRLTARSRAGARRQAIQQMTASPARAAAAKYVGR